MDDKEINPIKDLPDVVDCPDSRDYNFSEMDGYADWVSASRPQKEITLFDQGQTPLCTRYALQHDVNAYNIIEDIKNEGRVIRQQKNPWEYKDDRPHYLQDRLSQFKSLGLIEGWVLIQMEDRANLMKKALDMWKLLYTWAAKVNWSKHRKNATIDFTTSWIWHAFAIVWYEWDLFKIANSFGTDYGDNGYNYIRASDVGKLMSVYVIIDKDDTGCFQKFKDQQKAKQLLAIAKDLYGTGNPDQKAYFEKIWLSANLNALYK